MMKNIKKILYSLVCAGVLFSCSQDDISVEKNKNLDWEIDESIINDDIRTRIGYDPRFGYAFLTSLESSVPMLSLGTISITGEAEREIEVNLTKAVEQPVTLTLAYDEEVYNTLKDTHTGYELGSITMFTLENSEVTIPAGEKAGKFKIRIPNNSNLENKTLLPFKLTLADNDETKIIDTRTEFALKLNPAIVDLYLQSNVTNLTGTLRRDGSINFVNKTISLSVRSSYPIPENISVGLERYERQMPNGMEEAPAGIEGTLPTKEFKNITSETLSFDIQTGLLTDVGRYALPIRLVVYDTEGKVHRQSAATYLINITVTESNIITAIGEDATVGTLLSKAGMTAIGGSYSEEAIDDIYGGYNYAMIRSGMVIQFPAKKKIKSIRLKVYGNLSSVKIKSKQDNGQYKDQGVATFDPASQWCVIIFDEAVETEAIEFSELKGSTSIQEMDFYEE